MKQYLEFSNVKRVRFMSWINFPLWIKSFKMESLQGYVQGSDVYRVDERSSDSFWVILILDMYSRPGLKNSAFG